MINVFVDVETSGLDPKTCSIVQLGYIITQDGNEVESGSFKLKPFFGEPLSEIAKEKTDLTDEEVANYPDQSIAYKEFINILNKYIPIGDYANKGFFTGYNASFDMDFCRQWFIRNGNNLFGYYFHYPYLDVMSLAALSLIPERYKMRNFQLVTVYQKVTGKTLFNAHDALADIRATKEIYDCLIRRMYKIPTR